jgi:hypothetical protein
MNYAVIIGEKVKGVAEIFSKPSSVSQWIGEDCPNECNKASTGNTGQTVGGELINPVSRSTTAARNRLS